MNKKLLFISVLGLSISCLGVIATSTTLRYSKAEEPKTYYVDFFSNYLRQEFTLSNGFKGKGNNLIFKTVQVNENSLVSKPSEEPTRKNYEFNGWYKEEACENEWNFETDKVMKNTRIFAGWKMAEKEEMEEPSYTPPSTVLEDTASTDYVINSIMNFKVEGGYLNLPTASLMKLEQNKDNVLPLMEYKVKNGKNISATYNPENMKITVTCGENEPLLIQAKDNSLNWMLSDTNYETKAKKYESKALEEESYHVMLAGSSSIEFWTSSKEDLDPIVSYNHGIGGTTIEQWDTCLNQRLVFPYKPKMVVYYVGINNVINSGQGSETVWNNLRNFFDHTHEALPDTKVQYILMNLLPGYKDKADIITSVNNNAKEYLKQNNNESWLTLIEPGKALLKENGEPNAAYFRVDGLHLSYFGYLVWGGIIKESILNGLENY